MDKHLYNGILFNDKEELFKELFERTTVMCNNMDNP